MLDQLYNIHKIVRKYCEHMSQYISVKNFEVGAVNHYTDENFITDLSHDIQEIEKTSRNKKFSKKDDNKFETHDE